MTKYVALLRGINVGGRVVKMTDLQACFEKLGYQGIKTFLQSGNVVFTSSDVADEARQKVETAVGERFGYAARVFVYPLGSVAKVTQAYPFDASDEFFQHYVIFMAPGLASQLAQEAVGLNPVTEAVNLGDGVVYWRVKKGMTLKSTMAKYQLKPAYKNFLTVRNVKTLAKIVA